MRPRVLAKRALASHGLAKNMPISVEPVRKNNDNGIGEISQYCVEKPL